ncbi:MAG: site-specific integrase [Salinisphaeraceae bacterium]|nr:site-specific integrase [Salinisphaeraceae bacterium]
MSSIRSNAGLLFFDFRYQGKRCREYTRLRDTAPNRKRMQKVLDKIDAEITLGSFDYSQYFPGSKNAEKFAAEVKASALGSTDASTPLYKDFAETWFSESEPQWRRSHKATVRSTLDRHLIPGFGDTPVGDVSKADTLQFRSALAKLPGRSGNTGLSAKTINRIIQIHGQILAEAGERYEFSNPVDRIKRLKQQRVDIHPFTLTEVRSIIDAVRADYRQYFIVRFFTGLRTGELHGLQWRYVDFERRQILVRRTLVRGELEYTKTDGSQREVDISQPVFEALRAQQATTGRLSEYVFCNAAGDPIDLDNFTNRVWYPLLRHLGLEKRRPYQTRHTAATLWLGAGENPEWVARQLGHANTEMLFKTYSRFVPNLTRRDGSAMERLLAAHIDSHPTEAA